MNRRNVISTIGVGVSGLVAGCMGGNDEETNETTDETEELSEDYLKRMRDQIYDRRVENDQLIRGHNVNIIGIREVTDNSVTMECNVSINPVDDYEIELYYTTVDSNNELEKQWEYNAVSNILDGNGARYDNSEHEWVGSQTDNRRVEYVVEPDVNETETDEEDTSVNAEEYGTLLGTKTINSDEYWGDSDELNVSLLSDFSDSQRERAKLEGEGFPVVFEFESEELPLNKQVVFYMVWNDENTNSPKSGDIVSSTPPVMRIADGKYIYPIPSRDGEYNSDPLWKDTNMSFDSRNYSMNDLYQDDITHDTRHEVHISRLSNYSYLSPKQPTFENDERTVKLGATDSPLFVDTPVQYPWTLSYDFSVGTIDNARRSAERREQTGLDLNTVHNFINRQPQVMNHDGVRKIADKLGSVCELIGATSPIEQIRVVADYVQYLSHTNEEREFGEPYGLTPNTRHPLVTAVEGQGDCKDFTILANAILQQHPFDMTPNAIAIEGVTDYISSDEENTFGHVTTAIPVSDLELDIETIESRLEENTTENTEIGLIKTGSDPHLYIEMAGPFPLGYVNAQWVENTELQMIDNVVEEDN